MIKFCDKDFIGQLLENIGTGIKKIEEEFTIEELNARLDELRQEMMGLVRLVYTRFARHKETFYN